MWTYTAYVLGKMFKNYSELTFKDVSGFFLKDIWKEKIILHEGERELYEDLEYLERLGVLSLSEKEDTEKMIITAKDLEKLNSITKVVERSEGSGTLLDEYKRRIDRALNLYMNELKKLR